MSRTFYGTLATHLAGETLTLCYCWVITKTDGTSIYLTDHDKDLTFLGNTHVSDDGFTLSMIESGQNLAVDNAEVNVLLKTNNVRTQDIINGVYDGARVKIYAVNWADTSQYTAVPGGYLTKLKSSGTDQGVFELVSLASRANQPVGRKLIPTCDADFADSRCGLSAASYTHTGTVTAVTSRELFTDSASALADDYFNYGVITWTSGNNAGYKSEVRLYASGAFTLFTPTKYDIEVGDGYSAVAGCDRTVTSCKSFSNIENFRGFPFITGNFKAFGGPR